MPLVDTKDDDDEIKGDMTPMIDIIFLLLIFFILTTKFVPNERAISSLMPTDKGQASSQQTVVEPPEDINIRLWPAGISRHAQPSVMDGDWIRLMESGKGGREAFLQIGRGDPLLINGANLEAGIGEQYQLAEAQQAHHYIIEQLRAREVDGSRRDQNPVVIHCFSGLPWKYALLVYDAVRYYEGLQTGRVSGSDSQILEASREVNFAPPRIRNYHTWERGNELFEILNLR